MSQISPDIAHDLPFDPTYGYDLEALLRIGPPTPPTDFAAFWRKACEQARRIPLNIEERPSPLSDAHREVREIYYDSWQGVRIGAWLVLPRGESPQLGVVCGHGYGGRAEPEFFRLQKPAAMLFPCARGFNLSAQPDLPDNSVRHVLCGIEHRDTYIHLGCVADLVWCAASVLLEMWPSLRDDLLYRGGSFGGGIGAMGLPWDDRYRKAFLSVPSFGNHPLRVTLPCTGSGESVRRYYADHPEVLDVLAYYDAAVTAQWLQTPTMVCNALFDPSVPPPGQFTVYNAIAGSKELVVRRSGHFDDASTRPDDLRVHRHMCHWLV